MKRLLDELAEVLHEMRGCPYPRRPVLSPDLAAQFGLPITPSRWSALGRALHCEFPPLEGRPDGLWSFPPGWQTVWDLADYLSARRPDLEAPTSGSADWVEAQIFVGVRARLVEALNVEPDEVTRPARLMADLGAE